MIDKDVIKALECCTTNGASCKDCPAFVKVERSNCKKYFRGALALINRQQSKIKALEMDNRQLQNDIINANCYGDYIALLFEEEKKECDKLRAEIEDLKKVVIDDYATEYDNKIKAEAVKEFAERLKVETGYLFSADSIEVEIDNLVKEMIGE